MSEKSWPYLHPMNVRFRDVDLAQHVNNGIYATYIEDARVHYYSQLVGAKQPSQVAITQAAVKLKFRAPIHLHDPVEVATRIAWMSERSMLMQYQIRNSETGQLCAEAETPLIGFDHETQKVAAFAPEFTAQVRKVQGFLGEPVKGYRVLESPPPESWPTEGVEKIQEVRFVDVDAFAHVNNAVYHNYLEMARRELYAQTFGWDKFSQLTFVVGETAINYFSPLFLQEELRMVTRFTALSRSTFSTETFGWQSRTRRPVFHAKARAVWFDFKKRKSCRVPEWFAEQVRPLIDGLDQPS